MYKNHFTRLNPGLLIFMLDQSYSMSFGWYNGKSKMQSAVDVVNHCIYELNLMTTLSGYTKKEVQVVVISYHDDTVDRIIRNSNEFLSTHFVGRNEVTAERKDERGHADIVHFSYPYWIKSLIPSGKTPMAAAFQKVYYIVDDWFTQSKNRMVNNKRCDYRNDPTPIIINVSDGWPTDSEEEVRNYVAKIKNIPFADGQPLIYNIHLSENEQNKFNFPMTNDNIEDDGTNFLYDISSELPESFVASAKRHGFNVRGGEKLLVSNCDSESLLMSFMKFGTVSYV